MEINQCYTTIHGQPVIKICYIAICRNVVCNADCKLPSTAEVIWPYSMILVHTTMNIKTVEHSVVIYQQRSLYLRMILFFFLLSFLRRVTKISKSYNLLRHIWSPSVRPSARNIWAPTEGIFMKGKGKAIPLQAWTGPEGSRRLRLPDLETVSTWRW